MRLPNEVFNRVQEMAKTIKIRVRPSAEVVALFKIMIHCQQLSKLTVSEDIFLLCQWRVLYL